MRVIFESNHTSLPSVSFWQRSAGKDKNQDGKAMKCNKLSRVSCTVLAGVGQSRTGTAS